MDINYYRQFEPIDGKWYISRELGRGAYGVVYEVERHDFAEMKSALKIITIPADRAEYEAFRRENYTMTDDEVRAYYYSIVKEYVREIELMSMLKGNSNIVSYEDHDVIERKDFPGWDIFIRMELLKPVSEYFPNNCTREQVIKLAIDICKALEICRKHKIIHRDIKPGNIFVSGSGEFKLGDFGVAGIMNRNSLHKSTKGTYTYMAPEVCKGRGYTAVADIYSLGIVMYKLLNNNMEPFRTTTDYQDGQRALALRLNGSKLSAPANADARLSEIILKACEYKPEDRYQTPGEMRAALEALVSGTYVTLLHDSRTINDKKSGGMKVSGESRADNERAADGTGAKGDSKADSDSDKSRRKTVVFGIMVALLCLICIFAGLLLYFNSLYSDAESKLRREKFEQARTLFEDIKWYRDSDEKLLECDYLEAEQLLENEQFEDALLLYGNLKSFGYKQADDRYDECLIEIAKKELESGDTDSSLEILIELSDKGNKEASELINDFKYEAAVKLYEEEKYEEAKQSFEELGDTHMITECNYHIAVEYNSQGDYAKAMALFYELGDYSDSRSQYESAEESLVEENSREPHFETYKSIVGRYANDNNLYVEYSFESDEDVSTTYNLPHDKSEQFKIEDGVHYHLLQDKNWKKQWIFQKKSAKKFDVYSYIDNKVYTLELR